ncbi:Coiled-coil domain-containing protein 173 [Symbiodinium microadriaticum]|uniref:Coiled-coil domain-containing protein 173 n=1 Tax=Symbiodinium microadriaticum TaxID=2951 RepID=A0A1Q9D3C5_SYMMI|nr:Coiled-coil domain-containing protein 173 [Symbiodinium microadriaticum]
MLKAGSMDFVGQKQAFNMQFYFIWTSGVIGYIHGFFAARYNALCDPHVPAALADVEQTQPSLGWADIERQTGREAGPALVACMAEAYVITASELHRIKNAIGLTSDVAADSSADATQMPAKTRAQLLHEKSQARAKTWSNTLEGSRRKKAEEKRKKLEMEELERQKVDAEEAKIQLDQRRATIDRANKLLYEESDRMKSFHSKMMHCDVIAEREAQISLKGELKKLEQIRDDRFLEMEKQNYRKMLEREMKERETKEELSKIAAKAQKEQLAEYKEKRFQEVEDAMLEGELLRRKAIEDLEAERAAEKKRREMAIKAQKETQKANSYLKQIKAEDMLRQQKEEEKIQEYAQRKEKMLQLRKQKEEEVFQQKQAARNAMIDAQAKRLAEMQNSEDARVEGQVKQKEAADEKKRLDKLEMMRRWEEDIQNSRQAQIERKQNTRAREKAEDAETAKFLSEWCKVLDKQEQEENILKDAAARKLAQEHLKQVEISRRKKFEEKHSDKGVAEHANKVMEADTLEFHAYAEKVIRDYSAEGKNVIPLIKELRDFRKRVQE